MSDANFPDGIYFNEKHEKAPDFIRGGIGFQVDKAIKWLQENADHDGRVKLDIKVSKGGKIYLSKNDWKPPQAPQEHGDPNDSIPF